MKRTLILVALFLLSVGLYAQNASVKFQDISVEGSKQEMMQKLQVAGFETMADGVLKGNVESRYVNISIKTDVNNQVKGLVVDEMSTLDAAEAKARFNSLIAQFNADANYVANGANKTLSSNSAVKTDVKASYKQKNAQGVVESKTSVVFRIIEVVEGKYRIEYSFDNI